MTNNKTIPARLQDFLTYSEAIKNKSVNTTNGYLIDNRLMLKYIKSTKLGLKLTKKEIQKNVDISDVDDNFLKEITFEDLCGFLLFLVKSGNKECDRARKVSAIKGFFAYLTKFKLMTSEENPALELEKPALVKRNPVYLSREDSVKLLGSIKHDLNWRRDYCMISLFLNTGIRVSEMCNISLNDIRGDEINIIGKGNKQRKAYLNEIGLEGLKQWLVERGKKASRLKDDDSKDSLFLNKNYGRFNPQGIEKMVSKWVKVAELSEDITPHKLRHSFCTMMYASGVGIRELQELMGHSSIVTTQLYTHLDGTMLRDAVKRNPLNTI